MHKFQASILVLAIATAGASTAACGSDAAAKGDEASKPSDTEALTASASLDICGRVDAYAAASASINGALTLDGKPLAIAVGARVEGEALLVAHASVCLRAKVDLHGVITDCIVIGVGTSSSSGGTSGSSGGTSGSSGGTSGSSGGTSGSSGGCGGGCTGSSGGGSSSGSVGTDIDLSASLDICGALEAFTSAAAGAGAGTCTIAGNRLSIASGTQLLGEALVSVGANVCLHATIDVTGNVSAPSTASLGLSASAKVHVCGHVRAYVAASANVAGHVAIGGPDFRVAAGAQLTGAALFVANASVCIDATLDASGALTIGTVSAH